MRKRQQQQQVKCLRCLQRKQVICRVKQSKGVSVKCEECVNVNRFSSRFAFLPIVVASVSATSRQFKFSTVDWLINLCLFVNVMEANTYSLLKFSSVKASHCECVYLICGQFHVQRPAEPSSNQQGSLSDLLTVFVVTGPR